MIWSKIIENQLVLRSFYVRAGGGRGGGMPNWSAFSRDKIFQFDEGEGRVWRSWRIKLKYVSETGINSFLFIKTKIYGWIYNLKRENLCMLEHLV